MRTDGRQRLRDFRAPDEGDAEQRAWSVVRSAYLAREPFRARRSRRRFVLAPAVAVILAGLILSPAGATVGGLITRALGVRHAAPALISLPSPGSLLVSGPGGTWTAASDGSTRHLGAWVQASWSPHGRFVTVVSGDRLAAVDPRGNIRWAIARPAISDPSWFSPTGYRVAYLSAGTLRVIAGDGTGDHLLAGDVAAVAPAWRPGHPYQLAYVTAAGKLVLRDGDSGRIIFTARPAGRPRKLEWSSDGRRLLVLSAHAAQIYGGGGTVLATVGPLAHSAASDGTLSPDGRMVALVLGGDQAVVSSAGSNHPRWRQVLAGSGLGQVSFSPDGRWLLVSWPAADQWVLVRVAGRPRVAAVAKIAQQFSSGGGSPAFPRLEGWCCTAQGPAQ